MPIDNHMRHTHVQAVAHLAPVEQDSRFYVVEPRHRQGLSARAVFILRRWSEVRKAVEVNLAPAKQS